MFLNQWMDYQHLIIFLKNAAYALDRMTCQYMPSAFLYT